MRSRTTSKPTATRPLVTTALWRNTEFYSTAVGYGALFRNTTGFANTAVGAFALFNNTTSGNSSNAFGYQALYSQTTGLYNNGFGCGALYSNVSGMNNTAIGDGAGISVTGSDNTCLGANSYAGSGDANTSVGSSAGNGIGAGSGNVCIGISGVPGDSHTCIRNVWFEFQPFLAGTNDVVTVNADGRLGYTQTFQAPSSQRYKHDIKPMGKTSEVLFELKPVTFRYNKDVIERKRPRWDSSLRKWNN